MFCWSETGLFFRLSPAPNSIDPVTTSIPYYTMKTEPRLIRLPEVISRTGMPKSTICAKIADNAFPKQKVLSARLVVWLEADITHWIQSAV
jgi:prophage regulatory protein